MSLLGGRAHVYDIGEHPRLDTELRGSGKDSGNNLCLEHGPRGNFHIVSEFHVRSELEGLIHGNIPPSLEQHHRERFSRESITDDQFSDHVQTD
jgi:hypothetical protein